MMVFEYYMEVIYDVPHSSDQVTGRHPAGIACVHAPLGLLCVAALGLLQLTLLLLLPCFWHLL